MRGHEGILSRKVVEFQLLQMYTGNKYRQAIICNSSGYNST